MVLCLYLFLTKAQFCDFDSDGHTYFFDDVRHIFEKQYIAVASQLALGNRRCCVVACWQLDALQFYNGSLPSRPNDTENEIDIDDFYNSVGYSGFTFTNFVTQEASKGSVKLPCTGLTCHMGSHGVTCHPAEVTLPHYDPTCQCINTNNLSNRFL